MISSAARSTGFAFLPVIARSARWRFPLTDVAGQNSFISRESVLAGASGPEVVAAALLLDEVAGSRECPSRRRGAAAA